MQLTKSKHSSNDLKLSVLIHQDGLSFFSYNTNDGIHNRWDYNFQFDSNPTELLIEIEKVYNDNTILSDSTFKEVAVVYHHPIFSGVPGSVFTEENAANYLKYNNRLLVTDVISHDDEISALDYKCVYIAYSNINNFFFEKYGDFNYYHYTSLALPCWYKKYGNEDNAVIIDVKQSHVYITIFKNGKLILHNIYQHAAVEDILYYTLFTCEHNGLDPETMNLYIYDEENEDKLYNLLYTYIRNVEAVKNSSSSIDSFLCV